MSLFFSFLYPLHTPLIRQSHRRSGWTHSHIFS